MAFNVGEKVGDYQIVGVLGAGGMGKVYKVRNIISDRVEAMKVLLPDLANEPELADRFIREIKLLATLSHPNIAALHTAMRIENQLIMMMEFVEGRTLEDRLKEAPVGVAEATGYMCQALSALGYAHERGVVHRDIKPANMMVAPSGELKLMDFGIAKAVADRRLTMTGTTLGSLFYMSPEQVKGSAAIDGRSDLYSVGVTLYEIVTGTRPFKGDSDYSIMVAHLEQQPRPPIDLDPTLPEALNEIILTAIQKDPAERFQTAQAFRSALETVHKALGGAVFAPTMTMRPGAAPLPPPPPAPQFQAPPPFPQEAYAAPAPPPPMGMTPPPPPARASGGHRGLWLALGGVLVLALLVIAAVQLPRRFGASAGGPGQAAVPAAQTTTPAAADTPAAPPAAVPVAAEPVAQSPAAVPAAIPAGISAKSSAVRAQGSGRSRPSGGQASGAPPMQPAPEPQAQSQPVAAQPPVANVNAAALEEESERLGKLGVEANVIRGSLQNLENQQRSTGVGLRGDISASWKRMEYLLDQAEAGLKRQDASAAKKNLDAAEREIDRLDKFLGR